MKTETSLALARTARITPEGTLLERARRGDPSAQRALYDMHVDRIFRLTYRMTGVEH